MTTKLFPGITDTAARRLAAIGGSFHFMTPQQQQAIVEGVRAARMRGPSVKAIKKEKAADGSENTEGAEGAPNEGEEREEPASEEGVGDAAEASEG
jgi:hypothetical protein